MYYAQETKQSTEGWVQS